MNENKSVLFKHKRAISTPSGKTTETDVNICLLKAWTAVDKLLIIWKSGLSDKIKWDFFQVVTLSILLYGCITWMLTKCIEKKVDRNYTRMLCAVLNKSWRQHFSKQQLYEHLLPILQTI